MARHVRKTFLYVVVSIVFFGSIYHHYLRHVISPSPFSPFPSSNTFPANFAVTENFTSAVPQSPPPSPPWISTTSILIPNWEVLVIVSPPSLHGGGGEYYCLFRTNEVTPARFYGNLSFPDRATLICNLPTRARRRLPFKQPILINSAESRRIRVKTPPSPLEEELLRWNKLVYDSLTTENDVVLFVKGVNNRQRVNRLPAEFKCVFGDDVSTAVRTEATTSMQEVFRCPRTVLDTNSSLVKVSLEIMAENWVTSAVAPSVAYYTPLPRKLESKGGKSLLCATTMVYDVAKFLREWVLYHSKIGVQKFLLYDNGSEDDLGKIVDELVSEGFDISVYFWIWPKTQESGFSHAAVYARDACTWMMYIDVDEFIYAPSWRDVLQPSTALLHSLLLSVDSSTFGQFSFGCHEFGPSSQKVNPVMGVTQGYNCRRELENRHKSIVLLDAVDDSLLNVIHHFILKPGYKARKLNVNEMVVNHYKYQAWPEFKAKFRRRASAYVLDWTQKLNPKSNDRAPGLGFSPIEPEGWDQKFCEVHDNELKDITLRWFGTESDSGYKMAWRRR